jgi:LTXXQ motif family protein
LEMLMKVKIAVAITALVLGIAPLALAADHENQSGGYRELGSGATITEGVNPVEHRSLQKALMDARMGYVKAGLQLTPDQAKYWPAVEGAMRARAQTQDAQMTELANQLVRGDGPMALARGRADAMAQEAAEMKGLVDAWEPLSRSLAPDQKERMRVLAAAGVMPMLCPLMEGYPDCH